MLRKKSIWALIAAFHLWAGDASASSPISLFPYIFGGEEVRPGSEVARHSVLLVGKLPRSSFICSGVILTPNLILTAGHCLGVYGDAGITVYFRTRREGGGPTIQAIRQLRPEDYSPSSGESWNDLALLRLESPIPAGFEPVPLLEDPNRITDGQEVLLAGYGINTPVPTDDADQDGTGVLRQVDQKVLQARYGKNEVLIDIQGKGACYGDSGGPAFLQGADGRLRLFGVASHLSTRDLVSAPGGPSRYHCNVDMIYSDVLAHSAWLGEAIQKLSQ